MLVLSVKDFRKLTAFPVVVTEADVVAVLEEAGVNLSSPLELRVRIKDMDARRITAKSEPLDKAGSTFRLNLYVMPGAEALSERGRKVLNRSFRHEVKHMAQFRANGPVEMTEDQILAWEKEAWVFEREGEANALAG